jgi:hypothetical protein
MMQVLLLLLLLLLLLQRRSVSILKQASNVRKFVSEQSDTLMYVQLSVQ